MIITPLGPQPSGGTSKAESAKAARAVAHAPPPTHIDDTQLENAVARANQMATSVSSGVRFSLDDETGKTIVRIVDSNTGQLIRQIPSPEILEIARSLDRLRGVLIAAEA